MHPIWGGEVSLVVFFFILLLLVFLGVIILVVVLAVRAATRSSQGKGEHSSSLLSNTPLEILKKRYAQGKITREEYLEMRRDLES
jgi:putative membrane protein